MMRSILVACLTAFVVTAPAFAQQMEDSQADEPDEPRPATAVCLIGEHSGFPEADARTAALLVCDELRKQGISVGEPVYRAPYSASVYRVGLHRLGQKVLVRLSRGKPRRNGPYRAPAPVGKYRRDDPSRAAIGRCARPPKIARFHG